MDIVVILERLKAGFGDRLYVEVQRHGAPYEAAVEPELLDMEFATLAKDKRVIVLGRNAETSSAAASLLHHHGFDVCSVEGGVAAWKAAGLPVVKADGRRT